MKFLSFIRKNINTPFRIVFLNENSLIEEYQRPFRFRKWLLGLFLLFVIGLVLGYFIHKELMPKHSIAVDEINSQTVIELQNQIEELQSRIKENDNYLSDVQKILNGDTPELDDNIVAVHDSVLPSEETEHATTEHEEVHVAKQTPPESHAQELIQNPEQKFSSAYLFYFTPLRGVISQEYLPLKNHPAIDIQAPSGEPIKSIADGVVIFADWTSRTGYVVLIQHTNNVISVYKHNSQVYKKLGDKVSMGEVIAAVGNTGELTSGPHLHFEIWVNGNPENPKKFISF